jgi:RNA polymerase sigma factor (sigma-70 family)
LKKETKGIWESIREPVLNSIKISLLETWDIIIIDAFSNRLEMVLRRYVKYLPKYVGESEIDDLRTISQLEFLETIKVWDPELCPDVWPLAQRRILGAMKDHIRYISKSDPTRFYDWITDAAYVFMAINKRADFENQIETGIQLNQAMSGLNYREKKIVVLHTKNDMTFKEIGGKFGISESQISRIYKASIMKIKKKIDADAVSDGDTN